MYTFLKAVFDRTSSTEIGALLGDMSLLPDGGPADPAVWEDWEQAVKQAQDGKCDLRLTLGDRQ